MSDKACSRGTLDNCERGGNEGCDLLHEYMPIDPHHGGCCCDEDDKARLAVEECRYPDPLLRQVNAKGEVRTTSDSGASKGVKPARFDMIPADALRILAEHYGKGAEKYQPVIDPVTRKPVDNWRLGYEWSKSFGAMQRHAWQFWGGEDIDEETGSPHLAAVAWHALALLTWSLDEHLVEKYDDRPFSH